jgi:hypothetical protein
MSIKNLGPKEEPVAIIKKICYWENARREMVAAK